MLKYIIVDWGRSSPPTVHGPDLSRNPVLGSELTGVGVLEWSLPTPKVCRIIAFYRYWAIILPTLGGFKVEGFRGRVADSRLRPAKELALPLVEGYPPFGVLQVTVASR